MAITVHYQQLLLESATTDVWTCTRWWGSYAQQQAWRTIWDNARSWFKKLWLHMLMSVTWHPTTLIFILHQLRQVLISTGSIPSRSKWLYQLLACRDCRSCQISNGQFVRPRPSTWSSSVKAADQCRDSRAFARWGEGEEYFDLDWRGGNDYA